MFYRECGMTSRLTFDAPDLLEAIVAATRQAVVEREAVRSWSAIERAAAARQPRGDAFHSALAARASCNVIAECKRRSPSRGVLRDDYDPAAIARGYEAAGAAAISVMTEPAFFDGALAHLEAVRAAVERPTLRKDFIVTRYQVTEARAAGADAVLLIVGALPPARLRELLGEAATLGLAALVEVHDARELEIALAAGARIVGVNNRNLRTLTVDLETSHTLIARIPDSVVAVAESGLRASDDLVALRRAGFDAFLMGERLMTELDPGAGLRAILDGTTAVGRGGRPR